MKTKVFFNYDAPFDKAQEANLTRLINEWQTELNQILPDLPSRDVVFDAEPYSDDWNTNGSSWSNKILLNLRQSYLVASPEAQELKSTFFHESYHGLQQWFMDGKNHEVTALEHSIKEGSAVVFERTRSGHVQNHFDYEDLDAVALTEEIKNLGTEYDSHAWKFYHKEKKEALILYRVGAYIVDRALEKNPKLQIEDLATMSYKEIFELSGL